MPDSLGLGNLIEEIDTYMGKARIYNVSRIDELGLGKYERLPYSIRIVLENLVRHYDGYVVRDEEVKAAAQWESYAGRKEIPLHPVRVIMQDFTGVPAVVDLAAMRDAVKEFGIDPSVVNPLIPVHLIIDHSIQVDYYGTGYAFRMNLKKEYERNKERYMLLKWAQKAFSNFKVAPPGKGIIHQVNLEYLAKVVWLARHNGSLYAYPDSLLGTDSHTTMINGLSVLGWGVGGIEAEATILGQPYYMLLPEVVGVRLEGELPEGATATDLVLYITEKLRKK
ncbi:MAG: aconitate hydratase, partial [Desulfurococcales archaeon]|nr:aconitate hydratase [Desulfurococcales archaeon]